MIAKHWKVSGKVLHLRVTATGSDSYRCQLKAVLVLGQDKKFIVRVALLP